jgi:hypothetical protein
LVKVRGLKKPNVTLVDLTDFHTADDDDTKTINAMVKSYVEMPGTFALHVVKGDQNYGNLLGNVFLRGIQGIPRVTVLTHCDKLDKTSKDDAQRLRTTLNTTSTHSSLTVAVLGCARKDEKEVEMLRHLTDMDLLLKVGGSVLGVYIWKHSIPRQSKSCWHHWKKPRHGWNQVREQSPPDVLYQIVLQMQQTFELEKPKLMNELREVLADMTMKIKNYQVEASKNATVNPIDVFDDPLECGKTLFVKLNPQSANKSRVIVTGIKGNEISGSISGCRHKTKNWHVEEIRVE